MLWDDRIRRNGYGQADTGRPGFEHRTGKGQHIVILGTGVAGLCAAYLLRKAYRLLGRICQTRPGAGHTIEIKQLILIIRQSINRKGDWFWPHTCFSSRKIHLYQSLDVTPLDL